MVSRTRKLRLSVIIGFIYLCLDIEAKLADNKTSAETNDSRPHGKMNDGVAFADELKQTLEKYLFGICPQTFKVQLNKGKNITSPACDLDAEQQDLAGRLATLALRAHLSSRSECSRFGAVLATTLSDLARTAANRQAMSAAATNDANKKRKLSKSQKAKIQAKQRTALAVKKKAAAAAAAAAAKMAS